MSNTLALALENVSAGYTPDVDILQDLNIELPDGALRGLIGLNGAGKSTVLKTIMGFLRPRVGSVRLFGNNLTGTPPHACLNKGLYMLPQESSLFPYLSVRENLDMIARSRGTSTEDSLKAFPQLKPYLKTQSGDLSGGWQKMVEFAKAFLAKPKVLLIDEPTIGLSPHFAREVYSWVNLLHDEGVAVLLVDHNIEKVVEMAGYMYVLSLGKIVADGPTTQFTDDLRGQVRQWLGLGGSEAERARSQ